MVTKKKDKSYVSAANVVSVSLCIGYWKIRNQTREL